MKIVDHGWAPWCFGYTNRRHEALFHAQTEDYS